MFSFTEDDLRNYKNSVVRIISAELGIQDPEFESIETLKNNIKGLNKEVSVSLDTFLTAYDEWYDAIVRKAVTGQDAIPFIDKRDNTRKTMLEKLRG